MNTLTELTKKYGDIAYDPATGEAKGYINFQFLHKTALQRELRLMKKERLIQKGNIDEDPFRFFRKLIRFETDHAYRYEKKSGYKTIYAIRLQILLPKKIRKDSEIKKLISRFMTHLNPLSYDLPYAAFFLQKGNGRYIELILSEREVVDRMEIVRYARDYHNKDGVLIHKRGEAKRDGEGKIIKKHVMFSNKRRLFTLDRPMEKQRQRLMRMLLQSVRTILQHIKLRMFLKIQKPGRSWHYYNRQCVLEVNHAKRYIEYMCNHAAEIKKEEIRDLEEARPYQNIPIPGYREIKTVFMRYKARFEKGCFHDRDGNRYRIRARGVPYDELRSNITELIRMFEEELRGIVPQL